MNMTEKDLKAKGNGVVDKLEIISMEGRYYMCRFTIGNDGFILTDDNDKPLLFGGASAAKEHFSKFSPNHTEVVPPTGTDEMIGMPKDDDEMSVPL